MQCSAETLRGCRDFESLTSGSPANREKMMTTEHYDLIVVGGGPGGSTVATLVAMQGHRVLLLEKEKFPRHQIGESLLPSTIHGIGVVLGVDEEIKKANFMIKYGGMFRWGRNPEPWTFQFSLSPALKSDAAYAYQVERSKFDKILLDNARRKGVDVREEHTVSDVLEDEDRVTGVRFRDVDGNDHTATAQYVVVAAGNTSHFHKKVGGERVYSDFFRNIALYCYYDGGYRMPSPQEGLALSAAFEDGWFWYIPLSMSLVSVGAVIATEKADQLQELGHEAAMEKFIQACPIIKEWLRDAKRVTEGEYGRFRVRKDYSYCGSKFWRPGMVLVGDAACFVDPVFSSGVHLATYGGLLAARSINTSLLGNGVTEQRAFEEFEARYRREFGVFYQFLHAFYDVQQGEESYFWEARKVLNTDQTEVQAFVSLVGGVSSAGEPMFAPQEEFSKETEAVSEQLGDAIKSAQEGAHSADFFQRSKFMGAVWQESRALRAQALGKTRRVASKPIIKGGLIPSVDGRTWEHPEEPATVN